MSPAPNPPTSPGNRTFSKNDAQKLAAAVLTVAVVIALFWQFAMKPLQRKIRRLKSQLQDVTGKYEANRRLADAGEKVSRRYCQQGATLMNLAKTQLPPDVNAVAWVSDRIMAAASEIPENFEIISIGDAGTETRPKVNKTRSRRRRRKKPAEAPAMFKDLLFRIQLEAGYHELGRFLASLEKQNRFMRVKSLSMSRSAKEINQKTALKVELVCAFPKFTEDGFPEENRPNSEKLKQAFPKGRRPAAAKSAAGKTPSAVTAEKTPGDHSE